MPPTLAHASIGATVEVLGVRGGRIVGIAGTRLALAAEVLDFLAVSEVSS